MCGGCHNLVRPRARCLFEGKAGGGGGNPALLAARLENQQLLKQRRRASPPDPYSKGPAGPIIVQGGEEGRAAAPAADPSPTATDSVKREVKRSKVCGICNGEAETYHLNYGASSCFSCRAFFRRVVQKDSADKLKCKYDNNCELEPKSTTKCRKCRYDRCLEAGMQPGMVLQGSEKITRFRKLITKQMEAEGKLIKRVDAGTGPKKRGRKKKALVSDLPEEMKVGIKLSFKKKASSAASPPSVLQNVLLTTTTMTGSSSSSPQQTSPQPAGVEPQQQAYSQLEDVVMQDEGNSITSDQYPESPKVEDLLKSSPSSSQDTEDLPPASVFDERLFDLDSYYYNNQGGASQGETRPTSCGEDTMSPSTTGSTDSPPVVIDNTLMDFITKQVLDEDPSPAPSYEELLEGIDIGRPGCKNKPCACDKMLCNNKAKCNSSSKQGSLVDIEAQYSHLLELKAETASSNFSCLGSELSSYKDFLAGLSDTKEDAWYQKQLQKTWLLACLSTEFDPVVVQNIQLFHFGHREAMTLDTLQQHITKLVVLFHNFAKQQKEFVALSQIEQTKLMAFNAPLFVQYVLGRYFNAHNRGGIEQLRWMLINGVPTSTQSGDVQNALAVNFDTFNDNVCLFDDPTATQLYKEHLRNTSLVGLPQLCNGLLALAILFRGYENTVNLQSIVRTLKRANKSGPFSLATLVNSLHGMAELFEKHTMEIFNVRLSSQQICLSSCIDEETWLSGVLTSYREIVSSVNLGPEMINEFLMFNLDVPFSKHYSEVLGQIVRERMTRVLTYNQDFQSLNYDEQSAILKNNVSLCVTLHLARCLTSNASQQLMSLMGVEDKILFENGKRVLHNRPLKRIVLSDLTDGMIPQEVTQFNSVIHSLASYMRNEDLFDVLTHCLLFSSEHTGNSVQVKAMERKFFQALERRLVLHNSFPSHEGILQQFTKLMADVKQLTSLMTKYFLHVKEELVN